MYQWAATRTPCEHTKNELPPPFFQWTHQKKQPPGAEPPEGLNRHNLRQPGPPEGHSSSNTEARTVLIPISTTPLLLPPSHSRSPAPPQKRIQVADVQDFRPCFYWLFSGFIQGWWSNKLVEVLKQWADNFPFLLFFSLFKQTKNMPCVALRADFSLWFLI